MREIEQLRSIGAEEMVDTLINTWNRQIKNKKRCIYYVLQE